MNYVICDFIHDRQSFVNNLMDGREKIVRGDVDKCLESTLKTTLGDEHAVKILKEENDERFNNVLHVSTSLIIVALFVAFISMALYSPESPFGVLSVKTFVHLEMVAGGLGFVSIASLARYHLNPNAQLNKEEVLQLVNNVVKRVVKYQKKLVLGEKITKQKISNLQEQLKKQEETLGELQKQKQNTQLALEIIGRQIPQGEMKTFN